LIKISSFLIAFAILLIFASPASAQSQITTSLDITFALDNDTSTVTEDITLQNTSDDPTAVSTYNLILGTAKPENIKVTLNGRALDFNVKKQAGLTQITIDLDNEILSVNESVKLSLSYTDKSVVYSKGSRKIAVVPKFSTDSSFGIASLKMTVPEEWGGVNYASLNYLVREVGSFSEITFPTDFKEEKDIFLVFGDAEYYEMTLKYEITNDKDVRVVKKITVPNDTATQSVFWTGINQAPDYSYKDFDGNYVLNYILDPDESKSLIYRFIIVVERPLEEEGKVALLDEEHIFEYTASEVFWGSDDPEIVTLSKKITKDSRTNIEKSEAILEYVKEKLSYSENEVLETASERRGGLGSLNNPTNVICQSYVDLFVTLARSAGVPARAISGFGFPDTDTVHELPNGVLHSWAEIWDENLGWVEIDPTWEDTSGLPYRGDLGVGHVRWATYGVSSTKPELPVGYNLTPRQAGLNVTASMTALRKVPKLEISTVDEKDSITLGNTTSSIVLEVENKGNVVLEKLKADLVSNDNIFTNIQALRETATEDDENEIIIAPTEKQRFTLNLDENIVSPVSPDQESNFRVVFSAFFKSQEITKELKSTVELGSSRLNIILFYVGLVVLFIIVVGIGFFLRSLIYKNTKLKEKIHNLTSRY
jgi:transglutaminase-like putative cysteine protease